MVNALMDMLEQYSHHATTENKGKTMYSYNEDGTLKGVVDGRLARTLSKNMTQVKIPLFRKCSDPNLYFRDGVSYHTGVYVCETDVALSVCKVEQGYHWHITIRKPYGNCTLDNLTFKTEERDEEKAFKVALEVIEKQGTINRSYPR